jgi:tRNA-2-methylthio-N6-dimethylallyladenosine synthase
VPFTRGPEYSRPFNKILDEAKYLADNGTKEIILLGQNVNAYDYKSLRLSNLISEIEKISTIERIRYTTSHPRDMTEDLLLIYKYSKKLMPLIHLPVQSGSDKILKLMNRKHNIKFYLDIFYKLKKINPNIEFSSDFIIGYPGESENDFRNTINFIKEVKFINSYSYIFSPRPGTVAANLDVIEKKISLERLKKVQNLLFENQISMNKSLENKIINVLAENLTKDGSKVFGRSEFMTSVVFNGTERDIGKIVPVKITKGNRSSLFGELVIGLNQKVA